MPHNEDQPYDDALSWHPDPPMRSADEAGLSSIKRSIEAHFSSLSGAAPDVDAIMAGVQSLLSGETAAREQIRAFEDAFARAQGCAYGVMTTSVASANLLAFAGLVQSDTAERLYPGSEIILPATASPSIVWPLLQTGLKPVFVDIDPVTFAIDVARADQALTPICRGMIAAAPLGAPGDMDAVIELCEGYSLALIEDCRNAQGAQFDGKPVGQFGRVATFRLDLPGSRGGIAVTNDAALADCMRVMRGLGSADEADNAISLRADYPEFAKQALYPMPGYDLRPTGLAAGVGLIQLSKQADALQLRRANDRALREALSPFDTYFETQRDYPGTQSAATAYPIIVKQNASFSAADLASHFHKAGMATQRVIEGNITRQPALKGYKHKIAGPLDAMESLIDRAFFIENQWTADSADLSLRQVVGCVEGFLAERGLQK